MKFVLATFSIFLLLNVANSLDLRFFNQALECGQDMGISIEQMKDMLDKKDEKMGCVNACVMKKIGALVDGKLHEENLSKMVENKKGTAEYEKLKEHLEKCTDKIKGAGDMEECQLAGKFGSCMQEILEGNANSMMIKAAQFGAMAQSGIGQFGNVG